MAHQIPTFLVMGSLGAGKTRLFQRIAAYPPFDQALTIVNEFADFSIDDQLMRNGFGRAKALPGGCVCCTSRHALVNALEDALSGSLQPTAILMETTGLASPAPILSAIHARPALHERLQIRLLTVVDALCGAISPDVSHADAILLSKTDLVPDTAMIAARDTELRQLNPLAEIIHIAGQDDASLAHFLAGMATRRGPTLNDVGFTHDISGISAKILRLNRPVTPFLIEAFLMQVQQAIGPDLLRLKGFVSLKGEPQKRLVVQMVSGMVFPPEWIEADRDNTDDAVELVAIGNRPSLTALEGIFQGVLAGAATDMADSAAILDNPLAIRGL